MSSPINSYKNQSLSVSASSRANQFLVDPLAAHVEKIYFQIMSMHDESASYTSDIKRLTTSLEPATTAKSEDLELFFTIDPFNKLSEDEKTVLFNLINKNPIYKQIEILDLFTMDICKVIEDNCDQLGKLPIKDLKKTLLLDFSKLKTSIQKFEIYKHSLGPQSYENLRKVLEIFEKDSIGYDRSKTFIYYEFIKNIDKIKDHLDTLPDCSKAHKYLYSVVTLLQKILINGKNYTYLTAALPPENFKEFKINNSSLTDYRSYLQFISQYIDMKKECLSKNDDALKSNLNKAKHLITNIDSTIIKLKDKNISYDSITEIDRLNMNLLLDSLLQVSDIINVPSDVVLLIERCSTMIFRLLSETYGYCFFSTADFSLRIVKSLDRTYSLTDAIPYKHSKNFESLLKSFNKIHLVNRSDESYKQLVHISHEFSKVSYNSGDASSESQEDLFNLPISIILSFFKNQSSRLFNYDYFKKNLKNFYDKLQKSIEKIPEPERNENLRQYLINALSSHIQTLILEELLHTFFNDLNSPAMTSNAIPNICEELFSLIYLEFPNTSFYHDKYLQMGYAKTHPELEHNTASMHEAELSSVNQPQPQPQPQPENTTEKTTKPNSIAKVKASTASADASTAVVNPKNKILTTQEKIEKLKELLMQKQGTFNKRSFVVKIFKDLGYAEVRQNEHGCFARVDDAGRNTIFTLPAHGNDVNPTIVKTVMKDLLEKLQTTPEND